MAVLTCGDQFLLCHRHPGRRWYPNVWDVPGGHIEDGESPAEAVAREIREELGVEIQLISTDPFRIDELASDLTTHAWLVTRWTGEVANLAPDEHDAIAWFTLDELQGLDLADAGLGELLAEALERLR